MTNINILLYLSPMKRLKFNFGNAKLTTAIAILNLPAGYACPMAKFCLAKTSRDSGKVQDGPNTDFRCFGVASERFPGPRALRWHNFDLLNECKDLQEMVDLITGSLPVHQYIRPHSDAGDFFNETYFLAWLNVAINNPDRIFYTYTKRPDFIVKYRDKFPDNFRLTASYGGKLDHLIDLHNLKSAVVVESEKEAADLGLEIDHDDSHAINPECHKFALLIHAIQPAGTRWAKAVKKLQKEGKSYVKGRAYPTTGGKVNKVSVALDK